MQQLKVVRKSWRLTGKGIDERVERLHQWATRIRVTVGHALAPHNGKDCISNLSKRHGGQSAGWKSSPRCRGTAGAQPSAQWTPTMLSAALSCSSAALYLCDHAPRQTELRTP